MENEPLESQLKLDSQTKVTSESEKVEQEKDHDPNKDSENKIEAIEIFKEELREKYPIEAFVSKLGTEGHLPIEYNDLVQKRYENCVNCAAEIRALYESYPNELENMQWIESIEYPMNLVERITKVVKNGDPDSPFVIPSTLAGSHAGIIGEKAIKEFEKALAFNPDIVIPIPKSAVLPAIILKEFFKFYGKDDFDIKSPVFTIPKVRAWWSPDGKDDPGIREAVTEDHEYFGNIFSTLVKFAQQKEIRVLMVDHYVESGRSIDNFSLMASWVFKAAQDKGNIPKDVELKIEKMDLANVDVHKNTRDWIETRQFVSRKVGPPLPIHQRRRKLFHIFGKYFAQEFAYLQEAKMLETRRFENRKGSEATL
jgi:hypothetical protein